MYPFKSQVEQCPVCRMIFRERRDKRKTFSAHCPECKATFWWKPWVATPRVVMDSEKAPMRYCTKDGCVCRD